jgi:hypothetical protein
MTREIDILLFDNATSIALMKREGEYQVYPAESAFRAIEVKSKLTNAEFTKALGNFHTQTIEGFWSLLKRSIEGVYHSVRTKYLHSCCDGYLFRYNRRVGNEAMFTSLLSQIAVQAE